MFVNVEVKLHVQYPVYTDNTMLKNNLRYRTTFVKKYEIVIGSVPCTARADRGTPKPRARHAVAWSGELPPPAPPRARRGRRRRARAPYVLAPTSISRTSARPAPERSGQCWRGRRCEKAACCCCCLYV